MKCTQYQRHVLICLYCFTCLCVVLTGCKSGPSHKHLTPENYDQTVYQSIQANWDWLTRHQKVSQHQNGKVVIHFRLTSDGQVHDINVIEDNVGNGQAMICEKSILNAAPFPPWPRDLLYMIGKKERDVTFTFPYN